MTWHANLDIRYTLENAKTLGRYEHKGLLRILQSLYPEGDAVCHNVLVHPPRRFSGWRYPGYQHRGRLRRAWASGPSITKSDLFVINKTDLAPHVGADLSVMEADTRRMRTTTHGIKPYVMTNLKTNSGLNELVSFLESKGMLKTA